jgi:hypothetical protein
VPPAELVLGHNQLQDGAGVVGQRRVVGQVGLDPHRLTLLESVLQIDVNQLDQRARRRPGADEVGQGRPRARPPGLLEFPDDVLQLIRGELGERPLRVLGCRHETLPWGDDCGPGRFAALSVVSRPRSGVCHTGDYPVRNGRVQPPS